MTTPERARLAKAYDAARTRSDRAEDLGDHAGALIAAGDARRILRLLIAERERTAR